jgi:glycosyltransferase involved in cell wall biosynthesis
VRTSVVALGEINGDRSISDNDASPCEDGDGELEELVDVKFTAKSLTIAIIARNEAEHISKAIGSALHVRELYGPIRIMLIDSGSNDATVEIAKQFPIEIYRYSGNARSAAAGRRIATRKCISDCVFFLDGDCEVHPQWLAAAYIEMRGHQTVSALYGDRQNVIYSDGGVTTSVAISDNEVGLGGNALYRLSALVRSGGFQPFLVSEEEAELRSRIEGLGHSVAPVPGVMITHHTEPSASLKDLWKRGMSSFRGGCGHILRCSLGTPRFGYFLRFFNRYLIAACYCLGLIVILTGVFAGLDWQWLLGWFALGVAAFGGLWIKRRDLADASYVVAAWAACGIALPFGFIRGLPSADQFRYSLEQLK